MISSRFGAVTVALLGIALVPTIIHGYLGQLEHDQRRAAAVDPVLAGMRSTPVPHAPGWGNQYLGSHDWIARTYAAPDGDPLHLVVARTWDAKSVYHHPELAAAYGVAYRSHDVVRWQALGDAPVHVLSTDGPNRQRLAVYCLLYGDEIVGNPYWFQIRVASELLFRGRRPMTLVFVRDDAPGDVPVTASRAAHLLEAAVRDFLDQASGDS